MVKKCLILLITLMLVILGGCSDYSGASAGKIIPPSNQDCPLGGKWTVLQDLGTGGNAEDTMQQWTGSTVQFAAGTVAFGGYVWSNLSYKIKRVDTIDYLVTKDITLSGTPVPKTQDVEVITIYAASNFLGEVMKIDDGTMIFFVLNNDLLLKKVSDQADLTLGSANMNTTDLNRSGNGGNSGVLLGLRAPADNGYHYRTLWIAAEHDQLHPALAAEQLFFPRTSGFWELSVENKSVNGKTESILTARNVASKSLEIKKPEEGAGDQVCTESAVRIINYVGNDYVAMEKETEGVRKLQMMPVDKLSSSAKIKASDLLGDQGFNTYLTARKQAVSALRNKGITAIDKDELAENFGLMRKNGHWVLVGRINYQSGKTFDQTDFDLKIIPPLNLICYDTLVLNWHKIKDRVPDAVDAFTSPDKDIALVKTKNKLTIYTIEAEQLAENPLADIELQEGETVIMAEWATGSYVDNWEKSFLSYGAQALSDDSVRMR